MYYSLRNLWKTKTDFCIKMFPSSVEIFLADDGCFALLNLKRQIIKNLLNFHEKIGVHGFML